MELYDQPKSARVGAVDSGRVLRWEEETEGGTPDDEAAQAAIDAGSDRAHAAAYALFTTQPTTLAGIAALLEHVGQDECLNLDSNTDPEDSQTILTDWVDHSMFDEEKRKIAKDFPLRLAATMRSILGRAA